MQILSASHVHVVNTAVKVKETGECEDYELEVPPPGDLITRVNSP